ncbi:hypothetical protein F4775DRAFT_591811 [Biscogniauxia sp. FL1348]|nr:hypothetical protein F4775DRAFT_591811 [Biscogniauxia sp. FL1348]
MSGLSRRTNRLAHIARLEREANRRAREQDAESRGSELMATDDDEGDEGNEPFDPPDFITDFDPIELEQQLQQMQDETSLILDPLENDDSGSPILTGQDEELPPIEELQQLADFQNIDEDPFEDEESDDDIETIDVETLDTETLDTETVRAESLDTETIEAESSATMTQETTTPAFPVVPDIPGRTLASSRQAPWAIEDKSEVVPHRRNLTLMPDLHMALGVWAQLNSISDKTYRGLKEILQAHIKPEEPDSLRDLMSLPVAVGSLKKGVKRRLPLLEMRKAPIALHPEKMSSLKKQKSQFQAVSPVQDLYFFNPVDYVQKLLSSKIKDDMYFGMAILVDEPVHPWNSKAWASSIRATSGQFAHYPNGEPIFASDFVEYMCHRPICPQCRGSGPEAGPHKGRIIEVWRDQRRAEDLVTTHDAVIVVIEPLVNLSILVNMLKNNKDLVNMKGFPKESPLADNEMVLVKDQKQNAFVAENHVVRRLESATVDYTYSSSVSFDEDQHRRGLDSEYVIRRKCNVGLKRFLPVVKTTPIRGELEIIEFTREALVQSLDRKDVDIYTVPLILFADGFGLYRTMHKSIMGIYHSIAALKRADRLRQMNVMPLTLGPHASNDEEVWEQIGGKLRELEEGSIVELHGTSAFVSGFVIVLVGDFPQQQDNSGFRRPTAKQGCRMCDVTLTDRGDLNYDLSSGEHQRYHHEIIRQRQYLQTLSTRKLKDEAAAKYGLAVKDPALMTVLPALDIIKTRPADSSHSEFGGLTKMLHLLIIDQVLTPTANHEYAKMLRNFPMRPGWGAVQSPLHVLQYSLAEHGRWSVMAPLLFRTWLKSKPNFIKAAFSRAVMKVFASEMELLFGPDTAGIGPVDILIKVLVENAHSNILLTADYLPADMRDMKFFDNQIKFSRRLFQKFCSATAQATASRRGTAEALENIPTVASGTEAISSGPMAVSHAVAIQSIEEIEDPRTAMESVEMTTAKSSKYKLWMSRPNVHIGLHYGDVMDEYGLVSVNMVIVFELKHKLWKKIVYSTNHRSPEKDLFAWENFAQTIRFVLLDAYKDSDVELTEQLKKLHQTVPSLFTSVLRGQEEVPGLPGLPGLNDTTELSAPEQSSATVELIDDEKHRDVKVLGLLKAQIYKDLQLPVKESEMTADFRRMLMAAYKDYGRQPSIMGTQQVVKWWKKVSWDDSRSSSRCTKQRGQYIVYEAEKASETLARSDVPGLTSSEPETRYGRLDHIFTHDAVQVYRHEQPTVVALPNISSEVLYMVPFEENKQGNWQYVSLNSMVMPQEYKLLHVDWNVGFM